MRIAFVAGTLGQGGAERQLYYMLNTLRDAGADVRVLCLTRHEFWEERIRALGIAVSFVGARASRLARLAGIVGNLRARRPHLVQSQHFYTNLYASLAARALRLPEIGAIRNDAVSEVRANGRVLGGWSLTVPRVLAANSRLGMANAIAMGVPESRVRFLPNVVDTENFAPSSARRGASIRLLAVGRLVEQKRFDRFLQVTSRLRASSGLDVRATIVGAGPLREALESQARALEISDFVDFAGAVADMRPLYASADVLVLTSEWEGTPNVVLEAMACGLPVVSTRVGGVPDIVRDKITGVLVEATTEPEITNGLCTALGALASDPCRRNALGTAARRFVVDNHSLHALPRVLAGLYESVLQ